MNILLIGSGGREHALAWAMRTKSSFMRGLYVAPGNPGIFEVARHADIDINDHDQIIHFCHRLLIDLVVVGPEQPLALGLADNLRSAGIFTFGPSRAAAQIESSKAFAKDLMKRYNIPTADYRHFNSSQVQEALAYIDTFAKPPVVKADGLAAGKGVIVPTSHQEAKHAVIDMFAGAFGKAGAEVVIEEFMEGEEASVFAICDGTNFVTLAPAQDHKRISDGDTGKNTGGMGAYAPAPLVTNEILNKVKERIIKPLLDGMRAEKTPFTGCLFCGLMIHHGEPRVVEFNARFGDPETQAVLSVFEGDLVRLLSSAARGEIDKSAMRTSTNGYACNVVLAAQGYPDAYKKGMLITGIEEAKAMKAKVFHAGTSFDENHALVANGGRVLGVCGTGETLQDAINMAYGAIPYIHYTGKAFRSDIGKKGLVHKS